MSIEIKTDPDMLEKYYNDFAKLPKTHAGKIKKKFLHFPRWTQENYIFEWFDKNYPGGLLELMKKRMGSNRCEEWEELYNKTRLGIALLVATPPELADPIFLTDEDKKKLLQDFAAI